ncbi:MAG TPA: hypothetical protein VFZ98_02265, partial [Vicinamibacterales bacterium]
RTYAELSGLNGTAAGVGEAFSPLVGVWAPTFSACELAAAFLLPFVAIRVVGGDRQSGALKLEAQQPLPPTVRIAAKALVLLAAWGIAMLPTVAAALMWRAYGGSVYPPELMALAAGHVLNAGLTIAVAAAASSLTEHPSTAAIVTLSVTVGTWIVNFIAAVHGGLWQRIADFTPTAMVAQFQHGLVRLDVTLTSLTLAIAGLAVAAAWMQLGAPIARRVAETALVAAVAAALLLGATFTGQSWDLSEARINSLPEADEVALTRIRQPLHMEVHFAPEDPRRTDLEAKTLSKLRRALPGLQVTYVSATSTGLFEQTSAHYGEIFYDLGGRRTVNRLTSADGVLETIYSLAGITPPSENDAGVFRGHPLAVPPRRAGTVFYGIWPALVAAAILLHRRSHT